MRRFFLSHIRPLMLGLLLLGVIGWISADAAPRTRTAVRGIPFGPWNAPPYLVGTEYTGTVLGGPAPYRHLEEIRERKGHVLLYLARAKSREQGYLSVAAIERFLATWPDLTSYIKDGTVWGIFVSDDITGKRIWGPEAPYYPQIDSIARLVKQRWPGVRTIVRAPANKMKYPWKWVDWAWGQYSYRQGDVAAWRDQQLALADSLGLCIGFGLNIIDGGNGSSGVRRGRRRNWMSADEVLKYYSVLLPHTPIAVHWEYRPEYEEAPGIKAAMAKVRSWADTATQPGCRYHH